MLDTHLYKNTSRVASQMLGFNGSLSKNPNEIIENKFKYGGFVTNVTANNVQVNYFWAIT